MNAASSGAALVLAGCMRKQKNYLPSLVINLPALMYGSPQGFWLNGQTVFCGSLVEP
jgi:hypothetical protein